MEDQKEQANTTQTSKEALAPSKKTSRNTLSFDPYVYMPLLEDEDIPEDKKLELLHTLKAIVQAFFDLGFKIEFPNDACGQDQKTSHSPSPALQDHVYSTHQQYTQNLATTSAPKSKEEPQGVKA